jgi:HSP20 family protein
MNNLNRWNWLKDLETFQHSRDSLLSRSPTHRADSPRESKVLAEWYPSMEIIETDEEYLIKAELPDLTRDDVKVSAESGTLTIVGQRKFEAKETAEKHHGLMPVCASFGRTFLLPDDVSPGTVSAEIKDGVLVVRLIKVEKAKRQQVEVEAS